LNKSLHIEIFAANSFNCWELLIGQSAAKP